MRDCPVCGLPVDPIEGARACFACLHPKPLRVLAAPAGWFALWPDDSEGVGYKVYNRPIMGWAETAGGSWSPLVLETELLNEKGCLMPASYSDENWACGEPMYVGTSLPSDLDLKGMIDRDRARFKKKKGS